MTATERRFARMFRPLGCTTARIVKPQGRFFLFIGRGRNTKQDPGQWEKNGVRIDFDYVEEHTIASGRTVEELTENARAYKRLLKRGESPFRE